MMEKRCNKCVEVKPLGDFYRHAGMKDGHLGACKACHKLAMYTNRRDNPNVQIRERERYHSGRKGGNNAENAKQYRARTPGAYKAHTALNNAVRDGRVLKPEVCDLCCTKGEVIHGHHKDYAHPLAVVWLCARCHHRLHALFPELEATNKKDIAA